jgi:hypothetical protein
VTRSSPAYPALEAFCRGYLHQDFIEEHGTPSAALAAFLHDASPAEARALERDWRAWAAQTESLSFAELKRVWATELRCAWRPARRAALTQLLAQLATRPRRR